MLCHLSHNMFFNRLNLTHLPLSYNTEIMFLHWCRPKKYSVFCGKWFPLRGFQPAEKQFLGKYCNPHETVQPSLSPVSYKKNITSYVFKLNQIPCPLSKPVQGGYLHLMNYAPPTSCQSFPRCIPYVHFVPHCFSVTLSCYSQWALVVVSPHVS